MAETLIIERKSNRSCVFPLHETQLPERKTYYRFYQLKLRQLLTENQSSEEKSDKYSKLHQPKTPIIAKRSNKDYSNHITEAMKIQSQNINQGARSNSVLSMRQQRKKNIITYTITSTNALSTEPPPKSILKSARSSSPSNNQRALSAPIKNPKSIRKKVPTKMTTSEIDYTSEFLNTDALSKSNADVYTEASSTSRNDTEYNHQYARQSILKSMMLHFDSYMPSEAPKWNLYQDFNEKFTASISPTVYRNFERIIL